ncbi:hypothetical protein CRG98_032339 [Punica granatum]|uniref:Uncharacterized protein n=1 Tax=Punica granatum TaxID=22663 RepID=A0A2I0ITC2_PUNGR|nr:hypothetical protein CRG98_032339 [Punica granatum]
MDLKYWTRSPESSKYHGCYAVGMRWLVSIAICRTIKNLLDNGIRYAAVKELICRRLVLLLGRLPVCWGCPGLVMWDLSSKVERLRTLRDRESESAVVPAFVVPVILTSLVSHGITSDLYAQRPRCEASGAPVLKGAQAALSVVRDARELRTLLIKAAPKRGFRPSGLDFLSLEFARAKGPKDSTSECVGLFISLGLRALVLLVNLDVAPFWAVGKAQFAPRCRSISVETHTSRLNGLFDCLCLRLSGGYIFVGNLLRRSMRKGFERNSQGDVNPVYRSLPVTSVSFSSRGLPTKARVTIHDPAIRGERSSLGARAMREEQGPIGKAQSQLGEKINNKPQNGGSRHCGSIHRRITGASEDIQYGTLKISLGTKMINGTSERISEASYLSRSTPEHLQTPS